MGRRSKKSNDVVATEKPGNVGAKRESKNEMGRSAKKQKLAAAAASTNHGMNSMTASIPEKKLPTATSLDENSTSIPKEEDDINNDNEVGKSGQVHVDEPTRDTAPVESGKTADEPHRMSKKRSKKKSKKFSKKKLKKEGAVANQSANKEDDEASVDKNRCCKTVFVANLSSLSSKVKITEFFKDAGEIVDVRFTNHRGFCYVEFADEAAAQKALKKNGENLMGRDIVLSNEAGHKSSCNRGKITIFVKGVDRSQPLEEIHKSLREYFGSCGEITYVFTPVKRTGVAQGFAFLGFKDEDALSKALELNNTKLGDCILTVEEGGRRDGSDDGGKRDGFGGGDGFDSGRHDDFGSGGALDSSRTDFGSGGNSGFGGCPGCDSIFCHGGSFGGDSGNGFNSGNGFRGESGFSGGNSGEFGDGREGRGGSSQGPGGAVGHGRGGGRSYIGGGRSHSGGRAQDGGVSHNGGCALNGGHGCALNDGRGRSGGRSHSGGRGRGGSRGRH